MALISRSSALALLLCTALLPAAASTTLYSTIGLRNIGYQLTDLRPDDGAPASISWLGSEGLMTISLYVPGDGLHRALYPMDHWWSSAMTYGNSMALGNAGENELRLATRLDDARAPDGEARAELSLDRVFDLAPHSAINWTAQAYGSTEMVGPGGAPMRTHSELSFALYDGWSAAVGYGAWESTMATGGTAGAFEDDVSFYFANNGDQPIQLVLSALGSSMTTISPAPEPGLLTLLCCGLVVLAAKHVGALRRMVPPTRIELVSHA